MLQCWVMATQTFQLQTRFCYTGQDPWFIYFAFTKILKVLLSQEILVFAFTKEPSRDLMVLLCVCGKTGLKSVSRSKHNTNIVNTKLNASQSDSTQLTKLSSTQCNYFYFYMSVLAFLVKGTLRFFFRVSYT